MAESVNQNPGTQKAEIAVFDNFNAAQKAKDLLQRSELALQNLRIDGDINTYEEVAAMGTTVGPEAGLLLGAFYGGTLGVIFVAIFSTLIHGGVILTQFNQLAVVGFAIAGAAIGVISGNRLRSAKLPEQKTKGNPDVPRRFQLMVEGSAENISRAKEMLGQPAG
jgi:hypothetical protein